jgi:cobalt-zinc-cadmium efflux system outer membrane protein
MSLAGRLLRWSFIPSALGMAALFGGCAAKPAGSGFDRVQQLVADRTGRQVFWDTSSQDDARADAAVAQLLERPLTADAAVQIALLSNRNLQAMFENLGIAQADLVRAGLLKNPVFNGAYEFAAGGGPAKVNLSVTEDFLDILQIPLRRRAAGAAMEAARLAAADAALDLNQKVRSAFYRYQAAQQILSLQQAAAAGGKAAADTARRLHEAGNLTDLDLANEQTAEGEAVLQSDAAQADTTEKRADLNELMGLTGAPADQWKSPANLPELPITLNVPNDLEAVALKQRLDLAAARREAEGAAAELGIATQFALWSDASAGASAEREHDGLWETGPTVSVPIPLFDLGGASVAAARARLRQAQRQFEARAVEIQTDVRRAQNGMSLAWETARCYRQTILPARRQIFEQTMLLSHGMLASVFQLLSARDAQLEAQAASINAIRDYWIADAQLERAVGGRIR